MDYAFKERIGNPELFTGRTRELQYFTRWINEIKKRNSQSHAILARRKMGKTTLMERLFNITFYKNDGVIPFYYEVRESNIWMGDFCVDIFLTFIFQYIAFKSRKIEYLSPFSKNDLEVAKQAAVKENLEYLVEMIDSVEKLFREGHIDLLWETVRTAPHRIAIRQGEFIVQMIDEFQFMNATVYRDIYLEHPADTIAAGYLSTAESKIAPLLVSGSWVGCLMNELITLLAARCKFFYLENMPADEALEMVFKYSRFFDVPVTEKSAYLIAHLCEGSPFYTSAVMRSQYEEKELTDSAGLIKTLDFEILDERGEIKSTWMEYVAASFKKVNGRNAKRVVLYLNKHRDREVTRKELLEKLDLDMDDSQLESKLEPLVKGDIIEQGQSNFRYKGVQDNIFEKVFRGVYQEEIEQFDPSDINLENRAAVKKLEQKYNRLLGKLNYQKGYFAEYLVLDQLLYHAVKKNELLKSITHNLPGDFNFCEYSRVWSYRYAPEFSAGFDIDVYAIPRSCSSTDYTIAGEVKSRDTKKFSVDEVLEFERKLEYLKEIEKIDRVLGFIFSRKGFTKEAETLCQEKGYAYSSDDHWLDK